MTLSICKIAFVISAMVLKVRGIQASGALSDRLLASYDSRIVPKPNPSTPVTVTVDITLDQLIDLNEKHQHIHTALWVRLKWRDTRIAWNTSKGSEFENVSKILFRPGEVWTPDVCVYNEVGLELGRDRNNYEIHTRPDGSMRWPFPRSLVTACPLNPQYFPYDKQTCTIIVGSWGHTMESVNVLNENQAGDTTTFVDKNEWKIKSFSVERKVNTYSCCISKYSVLYFRVVLERAHDFYIFNLVFPCILISLVNVFGFLLPVPSGERISLNITALLGMIVFMIIVSEMMPPQADVIPNINIYFGVSLSLIALANLLNIFIVHLHFRGTHGATMSTSVRHYFIHRLGWLLCYEHLIAHAQIKDESNSDNIEQNMSDEASRPRTRRPSINPEDEFGNTMAYLSIQRQQRCGMKSEENCVLPVDKNPTVLPVDRSRKISHASKGDSGRKISPISNGDARRDSVASASAASVSSPRPKPRRSRSTEWKALAMVLDRLLFIILLCITLINNLFVLLTGL